MPAHVSDQSNMNIPTGDGRFVPRIAVEMLDHARDISLSLLRTFVDRPSYVLGVTSAVPGEGKTTLSQAFAEVMSSDFGLDVALLDCHPERPWKSDQEQIQGPGLSGWLADECRLSDALVRVHDKCSILPAGSRRLSSRDLLQHMVNAEALRQLRERYSLIILDLPDLVNPAAAALANQCDGVVLVVRSGTTPVANVRQVLPLLQNVTIHGAILNRHKPSTPAAIRRAFS